jgi:hypothetical protein
MEEPCLFMHDPQRREVQNDQRGTCALCIMFVPRYVHAANKAEAFKGLRIKIQNIVRYDLFLHNTHYTSSQRTLTEAIARNRKSLGKAVYLHGLLLLAPFILNTVA